MRRWPWAAAALVAILVGIIVPGPSVQQPTLADVAVQEPEDPPAPATPGPTPTTPAPTAPTPARPPITVVNETGAPVAGALVYRSAETLPQTPSTWQAHWADRNATAVWTDATGRAPVPPGEGLIHVRAPGYLPTSGDGPDFTLAPVPPLRAIAHRGGAGYAPENTIAAIRTAALMGATSIEVDVQMTSDQELVLLHDPTLDRTTNGTGPVALATMDEVRRLDAGAWFHASYAGEKVPTLEEALREVKAWNLSVVIELKMMRTTVTGDPTDVPTDLLAYELTLGALGDVNLTLGQATISSFGMASSHFCGRTSPAPCGWIVARNTSAEVQAIADPDITGVDVIHLHRDAVSEASVRSIHSACDRFDGPHDDCALVYVYGIRKAEDFRRVAGLGVDGIGADKIDQLWAVLG